MLNLRRLRYFLFVGRELHYGRAAELLHVSQPALSQQIAILEDELGVALLTRDRRRVELTPAGEALLEYARKIVSLAESAVSTVKKVQPGQHGLLRVAHTNSALLPISSRLITEFHQRYPDVRLDLQSGQTSRNLNDLLHGRVDIAFVRTLFDQPQIRGTEICREKLAVAVPARHALARAERISIADLRNHPVILRPGQYELFRDDLWTEGPPDTAGIVPDESNALIAVARGEGIFIIPEAWGNVLNVEGVVIRPFHDPSPRVPLLVAFNDERVTRHVQHFVELAREMRALADDF